MGALKYSEGARKLLVEAKRAVIARVAAPPDGGAQVIEWQDLAAAACATKLLDAAIAHLISASEETELVWPKSSTDLASRLAATEPVSVSMRPTPELGGLFRKAKGERSDGILELEDVARTLWLGAAQDWRGELCQANGGKPPDTAKTDSAGNQQRHEAKVDTKRSLNAAFERVGELKERLKSAIKGQDVAIHEIAQALFHAELTRVGEMSRQPRCVFTFMGPPGCGKTHTATLLGKHLCGGVFRRLDMSGYSTHDSAVEALAGSPPIYRGSKPGEITHFVNRNPECVLLFDEIDKAHPEVLNLFLQILDAGTLEDRHSGKPVSFGKATIVFTTNAGEVLYQDFNRSGLLFDSPKSYRDTILDALLNQKSPGGAPLFPPALCSRLATGTPILFRPLQPLDYEAMLAAEFAELNKALAEYGFDVICEDSTAKAVLVLSSGPDLDARRVKSYASRFVSEAILTALSRPSNKDTFSDEALSKLKHVYLRVSPKEDSELIQDIQRNCRRILLVDDRQEYLDLFKATFPDYEWMGAVDTEAACDILRNHEVDWVFQDLDLRGVADGHLDVQSGLECLATLHKLYPRLPIYILSHALSPDDFDEDLYDQCVKAGGARGYLDKKYTRVGQSDEAESFGSDLENVRRNLAREKLVQAMVRSRKRVSFDFDFHQRVSDQSVDCNLYNVRLESVPTSAAYGKFEMTRPGTRFSDVAGNDQAMRQLRLLVEWLKSPSAFGGLGAKMKRGVLMTGPPGTGKTLLARAVAGEAEVPFVAAKASEFITIWQGSGADSVRELFAMARKHAPAIVFVDEIDAIATRRGVVSESSDTRRQTLIQLLTEMDGFDRPSDSPPVVVLAATNREDDLDNAIKRPGRFDEVVEVGLPDLKAREKILRLHAKNKGFGDIDWHRLAQRTTGHSGADLEKVVNEALIIATLACKDEADEEDVNEAVTRLKLRGEGDASERAEAEARVLAAHEAGHAIVCRALFPSRTIPQITILGRGSVGGFVEHVESDNESALLDRDQLLRELAVLMGGRGAEEASCSTQTPGASGDLAKATSLAFKMAADWGLGETTGLLSVSGLQDVVSNDRQTLIERTVQELLQAALDRAKRILDTNREVTERLVQLLIAEETLLEGRLGEFWKENPVEGE